MTVPPTNDERTLDAQASRRRGRALWAAIAVVVVLVVGLQVWATVENTRRVEVILHQLASLQDQQLQSEKARAEIIALRIENELRAFFWNDLLKALGIVVPGFGALVAALFALRRYFEDREKERIDRQKARVKEQQDREKERLDRAAAELKTALEHLAADKPRERLVGIAGLQHFFSPDKAEYHLQALGGLVAATRLESDPEVLRGIRIAVEQAMRHLPETILTMVSWQGAKLRGVDLSVPDGRRQLLGIDFRDADLEQAVLENCDLTGANFEAARLNGARLDGAGLGRANLRYADFAGASLVGADLRGANLRDARVERMDIRGADLAPVELERNEVPWERIENWREAAFADDLRAWLLDRYGPAPSGKRILMLMWEVPPLVAGGTWTASYHLVRNLRRRGADVTIVVPWDSASLQANPFGAEVEVIPLGIGPPRQAASAYAGRLGAAFAYGPAAAGPTWWSPYSAVSPYGGVGGPYQAYGSSYGAAFGAGIAGGLWGWTFRLAQILAAYWAGSTLLRLTEEFRRRVLRLAESEPFEVIHAHDWVTFGAAAALSEATGKPWVAHFHSTEADRRPAAPDPVICRIERVGAEHARLVVVPSRATARRVQDSCDIAESRIAVMANPLSRERVPLLEMGSFEGRLVVFLGRFSAQKGPDRFVEVAKRMRRNRPDTRFVMYGDGEERPWLQHAGDVTVEAPLEWTGRGAAFAAASAVLVPSRAEPFGMVVLEAMQHRVPVLYPKDAGAAEVLESGVKLQADDIEATAALLEHTLADWQRWENIVEGQSREIAAYPDRGYEQRLIEIWNACPRRRLASSRSRRLSLGESRSSVPPPVVRPATRGGAGRANCIEGACSRWYHGRERQPHSPSLAVRVAVRQRPHQPAGQLIFNRRSRILWLVAALAGKVQP